MNPGRRSPRRGRLRFCSWMCHDSYLTDRAYGLAGNGADLDYAPHGLCTYCGTYVPTNAERRARQSA